MRQMNRQIERGKQHRIRPRKNVVPPFSRSSTISDRKKNERSTDKYYIYLIHSRTPKQTGWFAGCLKYS